MLNALLECFDCSIRVHLSFRFLVRRLILKRTCDSLKSSHHLSRCTTVWPKKMRCVQHYDYIGRKNKVEIFTHFWCLIWIYSAQFALKVLSMHWWPHFNFSLLYCSRDTTFEQANFWEKNPLHINFDKSHCDSQKPTDCEIWRSNWGLKYKSKHQIWS